MTSAPAFPDISISTERLVLRGYDEDDMTSLVEMMDDELITAWTGVPHPYTAADAREFVTRTAPAERTEGRGLVLAVTEFLTQRLVGTVTLRSTDWRIRATEIGYLTAVWARGEGYACESVLAVCRWLFEEQGFARVELRTAADNTASQQVAQKIGCVSEGVLRGAGLVRTQAEDGRWAETRTDLLVWSLLPEDLDEHTGKGAGGGDAYDNYTDYTAYADWR
ncbi:GNAT family N-acetyltransferase [Actinacidiphila sp. ITFR-21]|uniref:GNAT family N-acetyltransferase n=1 Tax=Actinacidiphila sp. ITFR-21 TaxID=3075199 RepID=UPI0028897A51|nr:GNAT family N-acetyltransferase [Streptomyces sp. ITFR-21]WNI14737.1 GNAT family N-acetyltransferase [Streptomyces sp. ITFR-21]